MNDSLLNKLIRKKYFEVNGKKANGKEILYENDIVSMHLSDETFDKFFVDNVEFYSNKDIDLLDIKNRIVYEDDNVIIFNKPVGMLSQGDKSGDLSVNTILNEYYVNTANIFKPSVVNRLDRNTEGIIIFAKTYIAAKEISKMIKDGNIEKHYKATVNGILKNDNMTLTNLYKKDEKNNKAIIRDYNGKLLDGYSLVKLEYKVISRNKNSTDIDINLITGKSHQIRAQMAYIGHPLVCDRKYMDIDTYRKNVKDYKLKSQKLICYKIKFGKFENDLLKKLSNKMFKI